MHEKVPGILKVPVTLSNSSFCFFCFLKFYSIKPSHFTKTKTYVKLDPKAANTAHKWERHIDKKREREYI